MTREYYDDNYGVWTDMEDEETREFYRDVQKRSVTKKCDGCNRTVKILPDYAYCNNCAEMVEHGLDPSEYSSGG